MRIPRTAVQAFAYSSMKMVAKVISFLVLVYFARVVGASHFGVYTYLSSVIYLMAPFVTLGMGMEALRRSKSRTLKFLSEFSFTFVVLNFLSSIFVGVIILFGGYSLLLAVLTGLASFMLNLFEYSSNTHLVWGRVRYVSAISIFEKLVFAVLVILLPKKTIYLFISIIVSNILSVSYLLRKVKLHIVPGIRLDFFSWPFFLSTMLLAVSSRLPPIIYEFRFGSETLGNFGAAALVFQGLANIVSEVNTVLGTRGGAFQGEQYRLLRRLSLVSGVAVIAVFAVAAPLLGLFGNLLFGVSFGIAGGLLTIMVLGLAASVFYYYPRTKLFYHSPKRYCAMQFTYAFSSVLFALIAPDIRMATILGVFAAYIPTFVGWILADLLKITTTS